MDCSFNNWHQIIGFEVSDCHIQPGTCVVDAKTIYIWGTLTMEVGVDLWGKETLACIRDVEGWQLYDMLYAFQVLDIPTDEPKSLNG